LAIALAKNNVSAARWSAFEILQKVEDGGFSSTLLPAAEVKLEPLDRSLCHELVLGVLRWQLTLDRIIEHFSNRKVESLDRAVLLSLRLGLYQLRYLTRIPASAAVDESVKLVQVARLSSAKTFVNAVLRRATREPEFDPASNIHDPIERLAVATSHPGWLIERWKSAFGLSETEAFAKANNETPPISFRVVGAKQSEVLSRLNGAGVSLESSKVARGAWRAPTGSRVLRELAENGEIYLQDEASQLVAEMVEAKPDECVLDLCSAPGGKTTLIGDRETRALVVAGDVSARRLKTVTRSVALQHLKNVSTVQLDASRLLPFQLNSFDRVLVDAPCSGTGTLRQNPEIRWRISADDVKRLALQQNQFLFNAAAVVKPGGRLVYSTCSVERDENEEVIEEFLRSCKDFSQIRLDKSSSLSTESGALRTWPHRDGTDGFFVVAFERRFERRFERS
jgi:16S rRNA (cytosine967-C5)-methyltransferase